MQPKFFAFARTSAESYRKSIEDQMADIEKMAMRDGIDWKNNVEQKKEVASAKKARSKKKTTTKKAKLSPTHREVFYEMLEALEKDCEDNKNIHNRKYKGILVWKIDRLSRNLGDFQRIEKLMSQGYIIKSVTETIENTYTGRLLFRILYSFAIYEDEKLSVRITRSKLHSALEKDFGALGGKLAINGYEEINSNNKKKIQVKPTLKPVIKDIYKIFLEEYQNELKLSTLDPEKAIEKAITETAKIISKKYLKEIDEMLDRIDEKKAEINTKSIEEDAEFEAYKEEIEEAVTDVIVPLDLIRKILYNNYALRYNGEFTQQYNIKDDTIKEYLEYMMKDDKHGDEFKIEGDLLAGQKIELSIKVPELQIVDTALYEKVQLILGARNNQVKEVLDRGIFSKVLYFKWEQSRFQKANVYLKPKLLKKTKKKKVYTYYRVTREQVGHSKKTDANVSEFDLLSHPAMKEFLTILKKLPKEKNEELSKKIVQALEEGSDEKKRIQALINLESNFLKEIKFPVEQIPGLTDEDKRSISSNSNKIERIIELRNLLAEIKKNELVFAEFIEKHFSLLTGKKDLEEYEKQRLKAIVGVVVESMLYDTRTGILEIKIKPQFYKILGLKEFTITKKGKLRKPRSKKNPTSPMSE